MGNKDIGKLSKLGNEQRQLKLSSKQRSEIASIAARARWDKYRKIKNHVCSDLCECATCGRLKYRHSQYSEIKCEFVCSAKNIKKI